MPSPAAWPPLLLLLVAWQWSPTGAQAPGYYGRALGALSELHHGVRGRAFAVDARTIFLQDFHYDGEGPAAYFYVGTSGRPQAAGALRLRDERGGAGPLRRYRGEGVTLALPDGKTLRDVRWFAVWCDEYSVNFGDVSIPRELEYPRPARVGALRGVHGVSSDAIVVVDAQTLLVPNFSYDGEAPDAKFWVGRGEKPSPAGIRIPDENGKEAPLRKYDKKTIVLTLPGELTVFDIGHFAVWCEAFTVNFGHVVLPRAALLNVPPSLKMLGVSPQSKLNCEVLHDELAFEVRWAVAGDSIVLQLVAKLEDGEYMAFGVSGDSGRSQMVGADVAVAWVDKQSLKGHAVDYYLDAKSQCAGVRGSCPDERLGEKTNSIRLLNAALVNGYSIVTYQRSLAAADQLDRAVLANASQPVVWALGPLNARQEVSYHHHFNKEDRFIEFGRPPLWNCPMPEGEDEPRATAPPATRAPPATSATPADSQEDRPPQRVIKPNPVPTPKPVPRATPWEIPGIQCYEPPDGVFYAQMGPTGGKQGYSAITGHVGWGISWYINGLLIPEITVVRGRRYTFVVEGGADPDTPARYHPFYITDDPVGGYYHKTDDEKKGVHIYAGVRRTRTGGVVPTGVGRLCNWTPDADAPPADDYPSFGAYQRALTLVCDEGSPGVVTWTPDADTPDTVYYQCFTHRYLGWKIHVVDACDEDAQESRVAPAAVAPEAPEAPSAPSAPEDPEDPADLAPEESLQVATRLRPDSNFLDDRRKVEKIINTKTNYNDFSSDKEVYQGVVSRGQIADVIEAVESIETRMREQRPPAAPAAPAVPHQYQVHEAGEERPLREGDEAAVARPAEAYFLPAGARPLTLQAVLRPGAPRPPAFRRPAPPQLRPPPHRPQFPLPLPTHHGPHPMYKKPYKPPPFGRVPPPMKPPTPQKQQNPHKPPPPYKPPQKQYGPKHQQHQTKPQTPVQAIIMGKPAGGVSPPPQSQTLSLGRTDLVADQVVRSQITLPGAGDALPQHSFAPGQIILGKPMDHPVPLDQQMAPSRQHAVAAPAEERTTTHRPRPTSPLPPPPQTDLKSSDFLGESTEPPTLKPAVNTGFKPNTIVIESGFKPIIREPLMDRTSDADFGINSNRREDTDVVEDFGETSQSISVYNPPPSISISSDKLTQSFEPMFIPSPPDMMMPSIEAERPKEVFPSNHAKEDRPHPVYVKTESELNALFGKKNMEKEVPADMAMEADKVSPQYLPPDPKVTKLTNQKIEAQSEQTFTTYDGKTVSASSLTMVPDLPDIKSNNKQFSSKLHAADALLRTPQFGPFKGEIPAIVTGIANESDLPVNNKSTTLKLVKASAPKDLLHSAASERHEVVVSKSNVSNIVDMNGVIKSKYSNEKPKLEDNDEIYDETEEDDDEEDEEEGKKDADEKNQVEEEDHKEENHSESTDEDQEESDGKAYDDVQSNKRTKSVTNDNKKGEDQNMDYFDWGNLNIHSLRSARSRARRDMRYADFEPAAQNTAPRIVRSSLLLPLLVELF